MEIEGSERRGKKLHTYINMRTHTHVKSTPTHSVRPQIHTHTHTQSLYKQLPNPPCNKPHTHRHAEAHTRTYTAVCMHAFTPNHPSVPATTLSPLLPRSSSVPLLYGGLDCPLLPSPSLPDFFLIPSFKAVLLHKTLQMSQTTEKESKTKKSANCLLSPPLHPICPLQASFSFSFLLYVSHLFCPQVSNLVESLWIVPCGPSQRVGQGASSLPPLGL